MHLKVRVTQSQIGSIVPACTMAERILAQQIAKDTRQYVPALTGAFDRNTRVYDNIIEYVGDQVNYLWNGVKMRNAATGSGPMVIPGVGPRWPKGSQLAPTSEPLEYTTDMHPLAGPKWMEHSERRNGKRWKDVAEEAVARGYIKY